MKHRLLLIIAVLAASAAHGQNPKTFIAFTTDDAQTLDATLAVYDMLGREIATLYHGPSEGTRRTVYFNTRLLPAGEYVCRLHCGTRETVRLVNITR